MSPRTWLDRVRDILSCAKNIQEFTAGMMFPEFLEDPRTTRAVAFEFTTIGEAARAIPEEIQERYSNIPWGKMQGIRNVLGMSISESMKRYYGELLKRYTAIDHCPREHH